MQDFDLIMTPNMIDAFLDDLISKERARNTILKYRHDLTGFSDWMAGRTHAKVKRKTRKAKRRVSNFDTHSFAFYAQTWTFFIRHSDHQHRRGH